MKTEKKWAVFANEFGIVNVKVDAAMDLREFSNFINECEQEYQLANDYLLLKMSKHAEEPKKFNEDSDEI